MGKGVQSKNSCLISGILCVCLTEKHEVCMQEFTMPILQRIYLQSLVLSLNIVQSTLVISTSFISNNRLSQSEILVPVLT